MRAIQNTTLLTPHERIEGGTLLIDGAKIIAVGPAERIPSPAGAEVIDGSPYLLAPGFIDLQLNGAFGHDFTLDPATLWPAAARLPQFGITSFLPTIITAPLDRSVQGRQILAEGPPPGFQGATPLGLHIEGPFLNPKKKGAHNPAHLRRPNLADVADWFPQNGVRLVTLAPELPGALPLIEALAGRGVVVSAGHSLATLAEAQAGFEAGITYGTHLFNAMPTLHHRQPGLIGALLIQPGVTVGLIADGIHVHPALIKIIWQILGSRRLTLVSDAMAALGMAPGRYQLGNLTVQVDGESARLSDGTLAGSVLTPDNALRNLIAFTGCSLTEALPTLTSTPAALLSLSDRKGRLAVGYDADLVLLNQDLSAAMTIVGGDVVYDQRRYQV